MGESEGIGPRSSFSIQKSDRYQGCLLGLACGDAVGTTLEFQPRDQLTPIADMVGGGPFNLLPGQWTDDTSMALCLAESLIESNGFNAKDQMNRYLRWWRDGHMSSTGRCFDIGNTVREALRLYEMSGDPMAGSSDPYSAGNGSLMRLAPVVIFFHRKKELARTDLLDMAEASSRTTHAAVEVIDACRYFAWILARIFDGEDFKKLQRPAQQLSYYPATKPVREIAQGLYLDKSAEEICGSGYVVESLEAALWCFHNTASFEEAVLLAANLGDDADTTAAICGQLAGAYYGELGIPASWLAKLHQRQLIQQMVDRLVGK